MDEISFSDEELDIMTRSVAQSHKYKSKKLHEIDKLLTDVRADHEKYQKECNALVEILGKIDNIKLNRDLAIKAKQQDDWLFQEYEEVTSI